MNPPSRILTTLWPRVPYMVPYHISYRAAPWTNDLLLGLQALFTPLGEEGIELLFGFNVNMYKAPALLAAIVNVGGVLMMYFAFEERYAGLKEDEEVRMSLVLTIRRHSELQSLNDSRQRNCPRPISLPWPSASWRASRSCLCRRTSRRKLLETLATAPPSQSVFAFSGLALLIRCWCSTYQHRMPCEWTPSRKQYKGSQRLLFFCRSCSWILAKGRPHFCFLDADFSKCFFFRLKQRTVNIACIFGFLAFHLITYPWGFINATVTIHHQGRLYSQHFSALHLISTVSHWKRSCVPETSLSVTYGRRKVFSWF